MAKKTHAEYVQELAAIGKVEALEEYKGHKTQILHRCLEHGEEHLTAPQNCLDGRGLKCCKGGPKNHAQYVKELAAIGKIEAIGTYKNNKTKILHRCLVHGEEHSAIPANVRRGSGLRCCMEAASQQSNNKRQAKARSEYHATISAYGKVEALEPYINSTTPILHRCLIHGEKHRVAPNTCQQGCGLKCCKGSPLESIAILKANEERANSTCYLYLARINGAYLKPGISNNPKVRAEQGDGYYSSYAYISPAMTRAEAWAIEQRLLKESVDAKPESLPEIYDGWAGYSELRLKDVLPESWYISRYWELMTELDEEGWEAVAAG